MLRLRDIMTTEVVTVNPESPIREAMDLFADRHISGAPVMSAGELVGVVSATDLLAFAAALPEVLSQEPIPREWEDERPPQLPPETEPAATWFTDVAGGDADALRPFGGAVNPEWNALNDYTVADVMTRSPIWQMTPAEPVMAAAEFMRQRGIHRVLVREGGRLFGIVTATDIANAVADHRLTARTYVFDAGDAFNPRGWPSDD
jgi:CBS domain-containing protein